MSEFKILAGQNDIFITIWADPNASRNMGRFYVSSSGPDAAFSVINIGTKSLYDFYTTVSGGRANEPLISENVVDLVSM